MEEYAVFYTRPWTSRPPMFTHDASTGKHKSSKNAARRCSREFYWSRGGLQNWRGLHAANSSPRRLPAHHDAVMIPCSACGRHTDGTDGHKASSDGGNRSHTRDKNKTRGYQMDTSHHHQWKPPPPRTRTATARRHAFAKRCTSHRKSYQSRTAPKQLTPLVRGKAC